MIPGIRPQIVDMTLVSLLSGTVLGCSQADLLVPLRQIFSRRD